MRSMRWLFVLFVLTLISCFKNTEEFIPNTDLGDVNRLLGKLSENKEIALLNADVANTLLTRDDIVVEIPAGVLVDAKGEKVAGAVVAEYFVDKGFALDIIGARNSANGAEDISTRFSFSIKFKKGESEVFISPNSSGVIVYVPYAEHSDVNTIKLYKWKNEVWSAVGEGLNIGSVTTGSWTLDTENGTIFGIGYKATIHQTGEFLVGLAKAGTDNIELCVRLPENFSPKNTLAVAVLPNEKMVRKLEYENGKFCSKAIARGSFVKVITLSDQDGQFLYGETSYKSSGNVVLTMVPKAKSLDEIWNLLIEL